MSLELKKKENPSAFCNRIKYFTERNVKDLIRSRRISNSVENEYFLNKQQQFESTDSINALLVKLRQS